MTRGTIFTHAIGPSKYLALIIVCCCSVKLISTQSISKNALKELSSSMLRPEVSEKALLWLSTHQTIHGSHETLPVTENVANTIALAESSVKFLKAGMSSYTHTQSSKGITNEITVTLKQSLAMHSTRNSLPGSSLNSFPPLQSHQRISTAHVSKRMLSTRSKESTSLFPRRTEQVSHTISTPVYDHSKLNTDQTSERLVSIHSTASTLQTFPNGFTSKPVVLLQSNSTGITDQIFEPLQLSQSLYPTPNVYQSTLKVVGQSFTPSLRDLTVSTSRVPDRPQQTHSATHSTESIQSKRGSNPNLSTDNNSQQLKPSPSINSTQPSRGELLQSSSISTEGRFKELTDATTIGLMSSDSQKRFDTRLHEGSTKNVQHSKFRRINRFSPALLVHPSRIFTNPTSERLQTTQIKLIRQKAHSISTFKTNQDSFTSKVSPSIVGDRETSSTLLAIASNHTFISSQRIHSGRVKIAPSCSTAKPDRPTKFRILTSKGFQLNNFPSSTQVFSSRKQKVIIQSSTSLNPSLPSVFSNYVRPRQSKQLSLSGGSFVLLENSVIVEKTSKEPRQRSLIVSTQTFQLSRSIQTTTFTDYSPNNLQSGTSGGPSGERTKTLEQTADSRSVIVSSVGAPNKVPKHTSRQLYQGHLIASSQLTQQSLLMIQPSSSPPLFSTSSSTTPGLQNPLLPARHQTEVPAFTTAKAVVLELFSTQLDKERNKGVSFQPTASSLTSSKAIVSTIPSISATVNNLQNSNELNATNENSTETTKKEKSKSTEGIFVILVTAILPSIVVVCMVCCLINNKISKVRERSRVEAVRARQMARKRHSSQASLLSAWNSREFLGNIPAKESKLKETISVDLSWRHENSDASARNQEDSSVTAYMDGDLSSGNPEGSTTTSERSSVERSHDSDCKNRNMKGNGKNKRTSTTSHGLLLGHPSKVDKGEEDIVSPPLHKVPPVTKVRHVASLSSFPNKLTEESNRNAAEEFPMLPIEKPHDNEQAQEEENDLHTRQDALKQLNDSIPEVLDPNNLARRKKEFRHQRWQKETQSASENEGLSNKEESK